MIRRSVMFKAIALLMATALILSSFGVVSAREAQPEDDEPAYDMMAHAGGKWIRFNSEDPTQWEAFAEIDYLDPAYGLDSYDAAFYQPSSVVNVAGTVYMAAQSMDLFPPHYLYRLNENMEAECLGLLTCAQHNVPHNFDGNGPYNATVWAMTYAEDQGTVYCIACVYDETEAQVWGIATLDLETYDLKFVCEWTMMGNENWLGYFWPITLTYAGNGEFFVIEAWSNTIVRINPDTYLEGYETIAYLPEYASTFPMGGVEQWIPQSIYYNQEDNSILWGMSNVMTYTPKLVKIDVATGETVYNIEINQPDMPGNGFYYEMWPMYLFLPYPLTLPDTLGDVDGSGSVNVTDALLALRYSMGIIAELECFENADMNGDGNVDTVDALLILRKAMNIV